MILKSVGRSGSGAYANLANYIARDEAILKEKNEPVLITWNLTGKTLKEMVAEFEANNKLRTAKKGNIKCTHDILSWSKESAPHLTVEIMKAIADKYIQLRGEHALYLGGIHLEEGKHPHLHLMVSASAAFTGDSMRISKQRFKEIKIELAEYEKQFPGLEASFVDYSKSGTSKSDTDYQIERRTGSKSRKEEIKALLETSFGESVSKEDFYNRIEESVGLYSRGGEIKGIDDNGCHYRLATLGYDAQRMEELENRQVRLNELQGAPETGKEIEISDYAKPEDENSLAELRLKELEQMHQEPAKQPQAERTDGELPFPT